MSLSIQSEYNQEKALITFYLDGSLDGLTANDLDSKVNEEVTSNIETLVFDMKELEYISSAGIRSVLIALKKMKKCGGRVALTNRQPQIIKVFEIMAALPDLKLFANQKELDGYLDKIQAKVKDQ